MEEAGLVEMTFELDRENWLCSKSRGLALWPGIVKVVEDSDPSFHRLYCSIFLVICCIEMGVV